MKNGEKYASLDGVRTYAILGILIMHVLSNGGYLLDGNAVTINRMVSEFGNFAFLFMSVSAFAMCCGYYDKVCHGDILPNEFYAKRYGKILPYFALLCFMDLIFTPSKDAAIEVFANLTLVFSFLPNPHISVIGVGWTLGVIFAFYIFFPFFCFIMFTKKRAWFSFGVSIVLNLLCQIYFCDLQHVLPNYDQRSNIIYSSMFFILGGLIYLYKNSLQIFVKAHMLLMKLTCVFSTIMFYVIGCTPYTILLVCAMLLVCAIGVSRKGLLINPFTKFISGISFEIYLCHMMIYRIIQKLHLAYLLGNGLASYLLTAAGTIIGSILFSVIAKKGIAHIKYWCKINVWRMK